MGQRLLAVVVVIASACTALHFSTTSQSSVVISNNPHTFNGAGIQYFTVSAEGSSDDDWLDSITMTCSSQWTLMLSGSDTLPTRICNGLTGSGSGSPMAIDQSDGVNVCPHSYTFSVMFAGTQQGTSSCGVLVNTTEYVGSASSQKVLVLTGYGSGSSGITVSPTEVAFGDQQINMTSSPPFMVTVTNNGSATVTVNGTLDDPNTFLVSQNYDTFDLGGGSSMNFGVTCYPTALGPYSATLSFTTSDSGGSAALTCTGINSTINIAPSQVNFDATLVGRPPPQKTVTVTGGAAATIDSVTLDSNAQAAGVTIMSNPQGMIIGTGKNIVLAYPAASMHAAGPLGLLSVKVSTDAAPRNVAISGEALLGGVGTNPASVEFGAVCVGGKAMKDIEVYASEPGDVQVQNLTKPAAPFDATAVDSLPKGLGGNHSGPSVTLRASLMPSVPGDFRDALALTSDVPNMATTEVQLHGIVLAEGIAATPNVVHFGTVSPGATTSVQQVQLTNCGTDNLDFTRATVTGAQSAEFTLIGANAPRQLKPTESEVFMVVMQPDTPGFKTAQLVLEHSAGTTIADLDGNAEGGDPKERETYYACSTGRGAGLWPIALALLALRRRRR